MVGLRGGVAVPLRHRPLADLPQVLRVRQLPRRLEDGVIFRVLFELDVAAVGDLLAAADRLLPVREDLVHLRRGLHEEVLRSQPHPLHVVPLAAGVHAQEDVVGDRVLAAEVVRVVRRHQRQAHPVRQIDGRLAGVLLDLDAAVLDLHVEAVAEHLRVPLAQLLGFLLLLREQVPGELPGNAPAQHDQPLGVRRQQLLVHPRLVVEALGVGDRGHPHEVAEARRVLGEQREVEVRLLHPPAALRAAAGGHVGLDAEDRVDLLRPAGVVELHRPVQVAVVGDRRGVHPGGLRGLHEFRDLRHPVQQRVVRVAVQVRERAGGGAVVGIGGGGFGGRHGGTAPGR